MITRTFDPAFLNSIANSPEVRPLLGGQGPIDVGGLLQDPCNFGLVTHRGGFVLIQHEPGIYESHTIFPLRAGAHALSAIRAGLRWMFTRTDCRQIVTKVACDNRAAGLMVRQVGFAHLFSRADAWKGFDGVATEGDYFKLDLDRWMYLDDEVAAHGERFHAKLERAKQGVASELLAHAHDVAHDRAVGAAALMIQAGAPVKGVETYNRWARLAGYQPIEIVTLNPLVIDVRDALVGIHSGTMEVLQCR